MCSSTVRLSVPNHMLVLLTHQALLALHCELTSHQKATAPAVVAAHAAIMCARQHVAPLPLSNEQLHAHLGHLLRDDATFTVEFTAFLYTDSPSRQPADCACVCVGVCGGGGLSTQWRRVSQAGRPCRLCETSWSGGFDRSTQLLLLVPADQQECFGMQLLGC